MLDTIDTYVGPSDGNIRGCRNWCNGSELRAGPPNARTNIYCGLAVMHLNAGTRGLKRQGTLEVLSDFLAGEGAVVDVVVVSESWLREADLCAYSIPGFNLLCANRDAGRHGGGVAAYVRSGCDVVSHTILCSGDGAVQALRLHIKNREFDGVLIGLYSCNFVHRATLMNILEDLLETRGAPPTIVIGDANVNLLCAEESEVYRSFFAARGFRHLVNGVTRPASRTCLDHIAVAHCDSFLDISPAIWCTPIFSDHYPVVLTVTGNHSRMQPRSRAAGHIRTRIHDAAGKENFGARMRNFSWADLTLEMDVDLAVATVTRCVSEAYVKSFPRFVKHTGPRRDGFRFSPGLRRLRRHVTKSYNWHLKMNTEASKAQYHKSLKRFRSALKLARNAYYGKRFELLRSDARGMWKFINKSCGRAETGVQLPPSLITPQGLADDPKIIADRLNLHFAEIGKDNAASNTIINDLSVELEALWSAGGKWLNLGPIAISQTILAMRRVRASWKKGALGAPNRLLQDNAQSLAIPLTWIFNLSLRSGVYPTILKSSLIIPLFKKKGDRSKSDNYRPITLVDYVSKVFEKIVTQLMDMHLCELDFFCSDQFGFRKARSTELALAEIWHFVCDSVEKNQFCLGVFLDLSSAFNSLSHEVFLGMLRCIGFEPNIVNWFKSYLSGRRQAIKVGDITSEWAGTAAGTPQGSINGPYMFIIFMNFILISLKKLTSCKIIAYADDTSLLFRIPKTDAQQHAELALGEVENAIGVFEKFGLKVNKSKTALTLFRSFKHHSPLEALSLGGSPLATQPSVKCLGLLLNEKLSWSHHLAHISPKCYAVVSSLRRLRDIGIPTVGLIAVYKSLLLPMLGYGLPIWGCGFDSVTSRLQIIQNDALRAIFHKRRRDSVTELYTRYDLLQIDQLYMLKVALIGHKIINGRLPGDLSLAITPKAKISDRRPTQFNVPLYTRESSRHTLHYRLPVVWGALPHSIRAIKSCKKFKYEATNFILKCSRDIFK